MNYKEEIKKIEEEIKKRKEEIKQLEEQRNDEMKKSFPNIIGKIYRASSCSLWKVKEITHVLSSTQCIANVVDVTVRHTKHTDISTSYSVELDINDMNEVSEQMFNEQIDEAIKCLRLQCQ